MSRNHGIKEGAVLFFLALLTSFSTLTTPVSSTSARCLPEKPLPKISEIRLFRKLGKIDIAIKLSKKLIDSDEAQDEDIQSAYNELIAAYLARGKRPMAVLTAQKAVERFPNISAEGADYPPEIEEIYERIRSENYGFIEIDSEPKDLEVRLDGKSIGKTPLRSYVPAGSHLLFVGEVDKCKTQKITIKPNKSYAFNFVFKEGKVPFLERSELRFGFNVDGSISWLGFPTNKRPVNFLSLGDIWKTENVVNYSGGIYTVVYAGGRLAVQAGVRYARIGSYVYAYPCESGCKYEFELRYVSFPINLNLYITTKPMFCIQAGAQFSSLISAGIKESTTGPAPQPINVEESLTNFNIALMAGLGFEIPIGSQFLYVQLQYYHGLDRLTKDSEVLTPEIKTRELKLSAGFLH